jgi:multidrug/hemolysin transport system permease protein
MIDVLVFMRRDIVLFLRDKSAVFFSFLSTIILIALYFLFIGKTYADGMEAALGNFLSRDGIYATVYVQMMAGVLVLNSMSLSVGVFSTVARDFETRKSDSFLLTPARPSSAMLAYFFSGFVVSFALNVFTWIISVAVIGVAFDYRPGLHTLFAVSAILLLASFISCALMLLFTVLVESSAAIGVFSGVAGTFFGFLCGIYMPFEMLGQSVESVGSVLPFTHVTILLKRVVLNDAFGSLEIMDELRDPLLDGFSANNIGFVHADVPLLGMLLYSLALAFVCLLAAGLRMKRSLRAGGRL